MNTLQQKRLNFLNDLIEFYSKDPVNRRSVNTSELRCYYRSPDGRKCAIGRHIPDEMYSEKLEGGRVEEVLDVLEKEFPDSPVVPELRDLGSSFLFHCQDLHDRDFYWNDQGLSKDGEEKAGRIKNRFVLALEND